MNERAFMEDIDFYRYDGRRHFNIKHFDTKATGEFNSREEAVDEFVDNLIYINKAQQKLYAEKKEGVIFVFQAMDAAGKDGVIRTVFSTLSPHGVKEFCFKVPSAEEKSHDFLWRFSPALPPKGFISIFNRSYYEDVLVGRVHKFYEQDLVPERLKGIDVIRERYRHINTYEKYLYNTGTRVVKIFLNLSKDEQARRFISRIDTQRKNWKVSPGDIKEREYWDEYMVAFEKMVNATSTDRSPWYVVPADHKWYARLLVSRIVRKTLEEINPQYPPVDEEALRSLQEYKQKLIASMSDPNLDMEKQLVEFSDPNLLSADMVSQDEIKKAEAAEKSIKDSGFKAVTKLLGQQYMVHSMKDIMQAIADSGAEEPCEEAEDEEEISPKEARKRLKKFVEKEEDKDEGERGKKK